MNDQSQCHSRSSNERLYDVEGRTRKAQKIRAMVYDFIGQELSGQRCLDIGCSIGVISSVLAESFGSVIGLDLDASSVQWAQKNNTRPNTCFINANGMQIPFPSGLFDVVICAQCYEHVADAMRLSDEVYRLLKPGGVCIFTGPNRFAIIEDHYGLPFLSWLPRSLADLYLRLSKRGQFYDVNPLAYRELRNLWKKFEIKDYTLPMLREPVKYCIDDEVKGKVWLRDLPEWSLRILLVFVPNYNWILRKPD